MSASVASSVATAVPFSGTSSGDAVATTGAASSSVIVTSNARAVPSNGVPSTLTQGGTSSGARVYSLIVKVSSPSTAASSRMPVVNS